MRQANILWGPSPGKARLDPAHVPVKTILAGRISRDKKHADGTLGYKTKQSDAQERNAKHHPYLLLAANQWDGTWKINFLRGPLSGAMAMWEGGQILFLTSES